MKIGIMTFWWSNDNYGQLLQCYALQKYLRDAGHDAYLIRYDMTNDYTPPLSTKPIWKGALNVFNPIKLCKYILYRVQNKKLVTYIARGKAKNEQRNFDGFRDKRIVQSEKLYNYYDELKTHPPKADVYIVGSDQIWNPLSIGASESQIKAYFLDFGDLNVKRYSYAPSFAVEKLNDDFVEKISPLLKKFDYVSVREKSSVELCRKCGINNAEWVADPTILLEPNAYRVLYKDEAFQKPSKPYVFFYFLGNGSDFSVENMYAWVKNKNLDIVYISANAQYDNYEKTYATIPEWIYLLEHAEYVVTNSFHCCVFSLIFQKTFGIIKVAGALASMNVRMSSLFEMFDLEDRFVFSSDFSILSKEIDWQLVNKKFEKLRNNCNLLNVIGGNR